MSYTIPILHMRQRQTEVYSLVQGHKASKWWSGDLNPGSVKPLVDTEASTGTALDPES